MITIGTQEELDTALYTVNLHLLANDQWRLRTQGQQDVELNGGNFEFSLSFGKLIFSFWTDDKSQSWRVTAYQIKNNALRLQVARQMGQSRATFEIRPLSETADDQEISLSIKERRRHFEARLAVLVESHFPGCRIERSVTRRDDWRQLSGIYTRLIIDWRGRKLVGIGVNPDESQGNIDGLLAAGIIWFDRASTALRERAPNKLLLFAPEQRATLIAERLTAIKSTPAIELYEYDQEMRDLVLVRPFDQGDLALTLSRNYYWFDQSKAVRDTYSDQIAKLAPDIIDVRVKPEFDSLTILGLEFARCYTGKWSRIEFGFGEDRQILTVNKWPQLESLIDDIVRIRTANSSERQHPYYTLQGESWLATQIQRDINSLDPDLDDRYVYSQVPAYKGEDRGYVDVLTVTRSGQLVVIELKVSEDPELPFQGLDYWLRVDWHRLNGEFIRRGFFPDIALSNEPPRLYLVAPLFRFHKTFPLLAHSVDTRVPIWRIGLNDNWRSGIRVLCRERIDQLQSDSIANEF